MGGIVLGVIVSSIAVGATVVVGILGHLIDKNAEPADHKPEGTE